MTAPKPHVVVDSSALRTDYELIGHPAETCLFAAKAGRIDLCFPEVVVMETVRRYQEAVQAENRALEKAQENLRRLTGHRYLDGHDAHVKNACDAHEARLRQRISRNQARILPLPKVEHRALLERDLARRRPFDNSGRGYRDALVWESVRELAVAESEGIVLVSENTKDFGTGVKKSPESRAGYELHGDLVADLQQLGLASDAVILAGDLVGVLTTHANLPSDEDVVERLKHDNPGRVALAKALLDRKDRLAGRQVERGGGYSLMKIVVPVR